MIEVLFIAALQRPASLVISAADRDQEVDRHQQVCLIHHVDSVSLPSLRFH